MSSGSVNYVFACFENQIQNKYQEMSFFFFHLEDPFLQTILNTLVCLVMSRHMGMMVHES